jgi:hypothetical protein
MRIVTFNALHTGVVCFRIYAGDAMPLACRIGEAGVTAQAKPTTPVDAKFLRILGMVHHRSVTVFTWYYAVKFFGTNLDNRTMARAAKFMHSLSARNPVFRRLILPLHYVGLTVVRVHKTPLPRSEVVRYVEEAEYQ